MSLTIAEKLFTGPYRLEKTVVRHNQPPCVFAVISKEGEPWDPRFRLVACGETGKEGMDFSKHPHRAKWEEAGREVSIYLHPMPRDMDPDGGERQRLAARVAADYATPNDLLGVR